MRDWLNQLVCKWVGHKFVPITDPDEIRKELLVWQFSGIKNLRMVKCSRCRRKF